LEQLIFMGANGYIVDNERQTLLTFQNIERLRDIPIHFIHGCENAVYSPVSTSKDYDLLIGTMGHEGSMYKRSIFPDKGHLDCWMGRSSYKDVYCLVEAHAREVILKRDLKAKR
jgi:hypothetical protein